MDLYLSAKGYLEDLDADEQVKEEIKRSFAEDDVPNSYEETVGYIKDIFLKTVRMRKQIRSSKGSEVVEKVLYYVSKNYEDEELSLNQVAEYAGFSANHLSTVFHQEYGEPFVKYLTSYRMEKAKKLLKETDLKTSDICYKVGYKDPHYFSSIFKKTQGVTPTRYREDYGI